MRYALERGNYGEPKLTDQILKVVERYVKKLIKQQLDIDEVQFYARMLNNKRQFYLETVTGEMFTKKRKIGTLHL